MASRDRSNRIGRERPDAEARDAGPREIRLERLEER